MILDKFFPVYSHTIATSIRATAVVAVLWGFHSLLRKKLSPRWSYLFWLLLAVHLLLPWRPESVLSIYNLFPRDSLQVARYPSLVPVPGARPSIAAPSHSVVPKPQATLHVSSSPAPSKPQASVQMSLVRLLPYLWLTGALLILAGIMRNAWRMMRAVGKVRPVTQQWVLDLLEDCKEEMGTHTYLAVVESSLVQCPTLFGFVRPRLLLPCGTCDSLGKTRLRHVFMHELAHLKRNDIVLNWVMALLQAMHWFNPLVWYGFHQARVARELACDALVIQANRREDSIEYGRTIIHLLTQFSKPTRLASTIGLLEERSQIKRRIDMIGQFKDFKPKHSWAMIIPLIVMGCVTLSDAKNEPPKEAKEISAREQANPVGEWESVDFVKSIDEFTPGKKRSRGDLYLKEFQFFEGGDTSLDWTWKDGMIHHSHCKVKAAYFIKEAKGEKYLFLPWLSGDVTDRGEKPYYYVLKKMPDPEPVSWQTVTDKSAVVGQWESVDFVKNIEHFRPTDRVRLNGASFKGVRCLPEGKTFAGGTWNETTVWDPFNQIDAKYIVKEANGEQYMFMEWNSGDVTISGKKPYYYVLKKVEIGQPIVWKTVENPAAVVGKWVSVDFVTKIDDFYPRQLEMEGSLFFDGIRCEADGSTSRGWTWKDGAFDNPRQEIDTKYVIKESGGEQYMFMEWISGDVTSRGMKPKYYVLKKVTD